MEDHIVIYTMVILFNFLIYFANLTDTLPQELLIDVKYRPEVCSNRSESGQYVTYHYVCKNQVGKVLENTYLRRRPFEMQVGVGLLPEGMDEGILDSCVGEKRHLVIPPSKTHQRHGKPRIEIRSDEFLYIDLEVLAINTYATARSFDCWDCWDADSDGRLTKDDVLQIVQRTFETPSTFPSSDEDSSNTIDEFTRSSLASFKAREQWRTNPFRPPYERIEI